jgi:hypothetical protein
MLTQLQAAHGLPTVKVKAETPTTTWGERYARTGSVIMLRLRAVGRAVCGCLQAAEKCDTGCWRLIDIIQAAGHHVYEKLTTTGIRVQSMAVTRWRRLMLLRWLIDPMLVAGAFGSLAGIGAYCAGPWLAATASAVGGFTTMAAVRTMLRSGRCAPGNPVRSDD